MTFGIGIQHSIQLSYGRFGQALAACADCLTQLAGGINRKNNVASKTMPIEVARGREGLVSAPVRPKDKVSPRSSRHRAAGRAENSTA